MIHKLLLRRLIAISPIQVFCINFHILSYLLHFFTFSLQIKIKMCRMYTVFHINFENIQYYFIEFNMVPKFKCINKVGVTC